MEPGSELELAYLAGFFDGEGCVSIGKDLNPKCSYGARHGITINVAQTSRFPLDRFHTRWGGCLIDYAQPREEWSHVWRWAIKSRAGCLKFLTEVRPYLILKGPQADLCLEFHKIASINKEWTRWKKMPKEIWDERERLYLECRALKKTVPGRDN